MDYPIIAVPANTLKEMFRLQKELVAHYIGLEGLPQFPVELEAKAGQKLIRDFLRRVVEELAEAYTELQEALKAIENNQIEEAKSILLDYNEEMADAWHFMIETLIYSGIDENSIDAYTEKLLRQKLNMDEYYQRENPLTSLMNMAEFYNQDAIKDMKTSAHFRIISLEESLANPYLAGGRIISPSLMQNHVALLWQITYEANMAANLLKARDWTSTIRELNVMAFQEALMAAFLTFIQYTHFTGIKQIALYHSYVRKNNINLERIKKGY